MRASRARRSRRIRRPTQLAQWTAAALLALFLLFLAPLLERVPLVALAAILVFAGLTLLDASALRQIARFDRRAFWHSLAVTFAVLMLGLVPGLLLGMALSLVRLVVDVSRPRDALLARLPDDHRFHDLDDDQPGTRRPASSSTASTRRCSSPTRATSPNA